MCPNAHDSSNFFFQTLREGPRRFPFKPDVNAVNNVQNTPLHSVAFHGYGAKALKVVKRLLAKGAHVNAVDMGKKTPLDHAKSKKDLTALLVAASGKSANDLPKAPGPKK